MYPLPEGSRIEVGTENGVEKIVVPQKGGGVMRYAVAAFLIFWLAGWMFGWLSGFRALQAHGTEGQGFNLVWLIGWSFGGGFALLFLFRLLRPTVPETLLLSRPGLTYDAGRAPVALTSMGHQQKDFWKKLFERRLRVEFDAAQMRTLALREHEAGNRLTVDLGNRRVELARGATDPEREWLHRTLTDRYRF